MLGARLEQGLGLGSSQYSYAVCKRGNIAVGHNSAVRAEAEGLVAL